MRYTCPKKRMEKSKVERIELAFTNGDYFTLERREIVEVDVSFYDELRVGERAFCPVASGGVIRCKLSRHKTAEYSLFPVEELGERESLKDYWEKRCLAGGIRYIRLFDKNCWHLGFYCQARGRMEGDVLCLELQPMAGYGPSSGERHVLSVRDVTKENVEKIVLDFENCDSMEIFPEEIAEMQLKMSEELEWNSSCFARTVTGGRLRLKFKRGITWRDANLYVASSKVTVAHLKKRLCYRGNRDTLDICRLYVSYRHMGYGTVYEEAIGVADVRTPEELDASWEAEDGEYMICGYAQKEADGSVLVVFGERLPEE